MSIPAPMTPAQWSALRRAHAAISQVLAGAPQTPAADTRPSRSSALRAALAISDAFPAMEITVEADYRGELRIALFGYDAPAALRISDTAAVAARLDQVTGVREHPTRDSVHVRVLGRLAGCRTVEIVTFLDAGDAGRLDELLAPLRALIRTADGA